MEIFEGRKTSPLRIHQNVPVYIQTAKVGEKKGAYKDCEDTGTQDTFKLPFYALSFILIRLT